MEGSRPCPYCAEPIPAGATRCRWCREPLTAPPAVGTGLQVSRDEEHLKLLSIFHYVNAALAALMATFPVIHLVVGILLVASPESLSGEPGGSRPPAFIGWFFVILAGFFIVAGWTLAICLFCAGRFLAAKRRRLFCLAVAGLNCLMVPLGTILGVFTILVLMRPSVKELFEAARRQAP